MGARAGARGRAVQRAGFWRGKPGFWRGKPGFLRGKPGFLRGKAVPATRKNVINVPSGI